MSFSDLVKPNKSKRLDVYAKDLIVQGQIDLNGDINITGADGTLLYLQNQEVQKLPIGTAGQVLKVNGTENAPIWGTDNAGTGVATALATLTAGDIIINTNNPTTPGDALVYNGLGQAVWQPQEGRANAFINASGNNIPILPSTPLGNLFLRYNQMGGYAEWAGGDPPPATPTVQQVFDAGSTLLTMTPSNNGYTNIKYISDATSDTSMHKNVFTNANVGAQRTSISENDANWTQMAPKQFESAYKFYLGTLSSTQGTVNALDVDATPDQAVVRNALHVYEQSNVINQYVPILEETDANEFYNNSGTPVSLSIASSQLIFQNDGDYIEFRSRNKYTGLDILLNVPNSMTFNVRFWNGSFYDNPGVLFDGTNNFTQSGQIRWNLQRGTIKNWQPQGIGSTFNIRLIRNQPVLPVAPSLADNGVKVLERLTNFWDKEGTISTKRADFDENITLGNNNFDTAYGLPPALQPLGGTVGAPRSNFMMISDAFGNMIFKQSPYLYSSSTPLLNVPIANVLGGQPPIKFNTDVINPEENGSLTVPPNSFGVGQSFKLEMGGIATFVDGQNIAITVEALNSGGIDTIGGITFPVRDAVNKSWTLNADFHITDVSGTDVLVAFVGNFGYQPDDDPQPIPFITFSSSTLNLPIDPQIAQTLLTRIASTGAGSSISTYLMSISKKF